MSFRAFSEVFNVPVPFKTTGFDACEKIARLKRANSIYEWVEFKIHEAHDQEKTELELDRTTLNKIFQQDEEGQKLMQSLLIRTDDGYSPKIVRGGKVVKAGQCMKYKLNEVNFSKFEENLYEGVLKFDVNREKLPTTVKKYLNKLDRENSKKKKLTDKAETGICCTDLSTSKELKWGLLFDPEYLALGTKDQRILAIKYSRYFQVLNGSEDMEYNERTYRLWSGLQNIKTELKPLFYKHTIYKHNYDISNAAITILLGYVESRLSINTQVEFPNIHYYLNNKNEIRKQVMDLFNLSYKDAKDVLMHLTNKGYISKSDQCRWKEITNDPFGTKLNKMRNQGHFLIDFYDEVKRMWKLAREIQRTEFDSELIPVDPKNEHRFNLYFFLERQILEVIKSQLNSAHISYLTEHDGFRTNLPVDVSKLEQAIFDQLQIRVKIEQ